MSKHKSQIGHGPIAKRQPPPLLPSKTFGTKPPVAKSARPIPPWLELPTSIPPDAHVEQVLAMRTEARERYQKSHSRMTRRELWEQLAHLNRWLDRNEELRRPHAKAKAAAPVPKPPATPPRAVDEVTSRVQPPLPPRPTHTLVAASEAPSIAADVSKPERPAAPAAARSAPERSAARLKVRIDVLQREQHALSVRLGDPGVQQDPSARESLNVRYAANERMLDELLSQWEAADSELALSNSPLAPSAERLAPTTVVDRLGRRLQAIRQRQQLTLDLLARRSGVPAEILGDIERGVRAASVDILADVARALGMTLSELFVDVDRPLPHDANRLGAALAGRSPKAQQALLTLLNTLLPLVP